MVCGWCCVMMVVCRCRVYLVLCYDSVVCSWYCVMTVWCVVGIVL